MTTINYFQIFVVFAKNIIFFDIPIKVFFFVSKHSLQDARLIMSSVSSGCICGNASCRYICSKCFTVKYCTKVCQESHWKVHKEECQILQDLRITKEENFIPDLKDIKKLIFSEKPEDSLGLEKGFWCLGHSFCIPDLRVLELIKSYAKDKLVLDIYAGSGYWTYLMVRMGVNARASDAVAHQNPWTTVTEIRSEDLCKQKNYNNAILFYGFPSFVDHKFDPEKIGYFPELKIWKGKKIMALVDDSEHDYYKVFNGISVTSTGMPLEAANRLTGRKFELKCRYKLKYQLYKDKNACFEVYEAS